MQLNKTIIETIYDKKFNYKKIDRVEYIKNKIDDLIVLKQATAKLLDIPMDKFDIDRLTFKTYISDKNNYVSINNEMYIVPDSILDINNKHFIFNDFDMISLALATLDNKYKDKMEDKSFKYLSMIHSFRFILTELDISNNWYDIFNLKLSLITLIGLYIGRDEEARLINLMKEPDEIMSHNTDYNKNIIHNEKSNINKAIKYINFKLTTEYENYKKHYGVDILKLYELDGEEYDVL